MNSEKTAGPSNPGKAASIFFQLTRSHSLLPIWNASQQAPVPQAAWHISRRQTTSKTLGGPPPCNSGTIGI